MVVLYFNCNFDVVGQGSKPYLPMPPSGLEAINYVDLFKEPLLVSLIISIVFL